MFAYYIILFIAIILTLYIVTGILFSKKLRIRYFDISINKNIDLKGYKIALLSDLHGRKVADLADTIMQQNPDIIIFAGDMIDAYDKNADNEVELAEKLSSDIPIIAVRGNHFYKADTKAREQMETAFLNQGIISLKNERKEILYKNSVIAFDGIDDPIHIVGYKDIRKKDMLIRNDAEVKKSIIHINTTETNADIKIAICHRPSYVEHFVDERYDLLLCGHTHGGQLAMPCGIEIIGNEAKLFPAKNMTSGLHYHKKMPVIITSGIGYSNIKIRTFMPHEIVVISFT